MLGAKRKWYENSGVQIWTNLFYRTNSLLWEISWFFDTWRWDRYVVPKSRWGITTKRWVIAQKNAVLKLLLTAKKQPLFCIHSQLNLIYIVISNKLCFVWIIFSHLSLSLPRDLFHLTFTDKNFICISSYMCSACLAESHNFTFVYSKMIDIHFNYWLPRYLLRSANLVC